VRGAGWFAFAFSAAVETDVETDGAVDDFDYLEHCGFATQRQDGEAAEFAASHKSEDLRDAGDLEGAEA